MRRLRLLCPLTVLFALGAVTSAVAVDANVDVTPEFSFAPKERRIAVGDTVTWTFRDGGHTTTSRRGQPDSWSSRLRNAGTTFRHTFTKAGRYQYYCEPHESFMRGTIVVGQDAERDTVDGVKVSREGSTATLRFKLNEAAKMTFRLKGPSKRTVKRARLAEGRRSFELKRLEDGRYNGTLTLTDDFDKKAVVRRSFVIG